MAQLPYHERMGRTIAEVNEEIRAAAELVRNAPEPRFDRIACRDPRYTFAGVARRPHRDFMGALELAPILGIPVFADETLEPGVIELRMGDEVVERVVLGASA